MHAFSRFGALVGISIFSFITIALLLPSRISTRIQGIGKNVYTDWISNSKETVSLVVFGDSFADDGSFFGEGKSGEREQGEGWTQVLCNKMKCSSHLNFASSALRTWTEPPSGAIVNNEFSTHEKNSTLLPDLTTQVSSYLALLPHLRHSKTLFVLSFGFWDIYSYSMLSQEAGLKQVEASIDLIFKQLDRLFAAQVEASEIRTRARQARSESTEGEDVATTEGIAEETHSLEIIIPQLLDPTLSPGWRALRPIPLAPTSIAEEQKNAVFLTTKWNSLLEHRISQWVSEAPVQLPTETRGDQPKWAKDVFYYDFGTYVIDAIRDRQLTDRGVTDSTGMGTEGAEFEKVDAPCVGIDVEERCEIPDRFLWWDEFSLGQTANRQLGERVRQFIFGASDDEGVVKKGGRSQTD